MSAQLEYRGSDEVIAFKHAISGRTTEVCSPEFANDEREQAVLQRQIDELDSDPRWERVTAPRDRAVRHENVKERRQRAQH